jgi:hypothetical protein
MRSPLFSRFPLVAIAAVLASTLLPTGCVGRPRISYIPYNYYSWNHHEAVYYSQWEHDTHRDHVDFTVLSDADMRTFWEWRHRQPEQH